MHLIDFDIKSNDKYERKIDFQGFVNVIAQLYFSALPKKLDTGKFRKIVIEITAEAEEKNISDMIDVVLVNVEMDFQSFWNLPAKEKNLLVLDRVQSGINLLADTYGWNRSVFEDAYNQVIEKGFVLQSFWRKPAMSLDKKMKAQLFLDFDNERINVDLVIRDRMGRKEIARKFIKSVQPHLFFVDYELGGIKWSERGVSILDKQSSIEYILCIPSKCPAVESHKI